MFKNLKIDSKTATRLIVLLIALINQTLVVFGVSPMPFTTAEIEAGVTAVFTVIATLWATWKNNDITPEAHKGSKYMRRLKEKRKDGDI